MQKPTSATPVDRCLNLAAYFDTATARYADLFGPDKPVRAQLAALAKGLRAPAAELSKTQSDATKAAAATIAPRVEVKLVDLKADAIVRSVQRFATEAGVVDSVFPDGITPIVRPIGQGEIDALTSLVARLKASKWEDRNAQAKRVTDVQAEYQSALEKRRAAATALGQARAVRDTAKEDFLDAYAQAIAGIQSLFPRDRATQDIFFDDVRAASAGDGGEEDPPAGPAAPANG